MQDPLHAHEFSAEGIRLQDSERQERNRFTVGSSAVHTARNCCLHWGLGRRGRDWRRPPEPYWPVQTEPFNNDAVQTAFTLNSRGERVVEIYLDLSQGWLKSSGRGMHLPLVEETYEETPFEADARQRLGGLNYYCRGREEFLVVAAPFRVVSRSAQWCSTGLRSVRPTVCMATLLGYSPVGLGVCDNLPLYQQSVSVGVRSEPQAAGWCWSVKPLGFAGTAQPTGVCSDG